MDPSLPAPVVGPPADLWRRAVARVADLSTVFFTMWALITIRVLWFVPKYADDLDPSPWGRFFVPTLAFLVLFAAYEVAFLHWSKGQTPGRDWMKVRVVAADGGDPTLAVALRRALAPLLVVLAVPVWWLAGLGAALVGAPALTGAHRRSLPDLLAGTTVVSYDRDAHEPPDPRAQRRRPRALRMLGGASRNPDGLDRWVAPDPGGARRSEAPPSTRRSPALSGHGKRRAQ